MVHEFKQLVDEFLFEGEFLGAEKYGFGHINETFAARFRLNNGNSRRYILQRINHNVFKRPEAVMHNMTRVTSHLRGKIRQAGGDELRETINLIPSRNGREYIRTQEGEYWRAEIFIEGAQTYPNPPRPEHYYNAAWAFGQFGSLLADFPVEELETTIPDFHNTPLRFTTLLQAVETDPVHRVQEVEKEINFCLARGKDINRLVSLAAGGQMPLRVTHNDTKFENVMIDDETGRGVCVIDLDTVMPGFIILDFGDAVRSGANPVSEDETNLDKIKLDLEVFTHLANGYLGAARKFLSPVEIDNLVYASWLITLEQAFRFLTDYINGDVYYRIHRPNHNLDRCRTQIKMVQEMEHHFSRLESIVSLYR